MLYVDTTYFDNKKKANLMFSEHLMDPNKPYKSMLGELSAINPKQVPQPDGPIWWSMKFKRYRNSKEQEAYVKNGYVDNEPIPEE